MYKNVIFDADGTIINAYKDVSESLCWALKKSGYPEPSNQTLRKFIGPSLFDSLNKIFGVTPVEAEKIIGLYREKYSKLNHSGTELYYGFPQLFERLKDVGIKMSVASTKPERFLITIFKKLGIAQYFDKIVGSTDEAKTSDKASIVTKAMLDNNAVMVGDRKFDIIAASDLGIDSIGVTYGFMEQGEFDTYRPTFIANNTEDIYKFAISGK